MSGKSSKGWSKKKFTGEWAKTLQAFLEKQQDEESKITDGKGFEHLVQISREFAHQLNNLLTTVLANAQLVSLMVKDEELMPYLKSVEDATRDAGTIVHDFQRSLRALDSSASYRGLSDGAHRSNP